MGARIGGLIMIGIGLLLLSVTTGLHYLVATYIAAPLGLPVMLTGLTSGIIVLFMGWLQMLFGVPFKQLNAQFSEASAIKKLGLGIVYALSSLVFLILFIFILTRF